MFCNKCGQIINQSSPYCKHCGAFLGNSQAQQSTAMPQGVQPASQPVPQPPAPVHTPVILGKTPEAPKETSGKKSILIGIVSGVALLAIIVSAVLLTRNEPTNYYFSTNNPNLTVATSLKDSSKGSGKKGKHTTSFVYDHTYTNLAPNASETDIENLIKKDSESQKANCPSEIRTVEDQIIKDYGITAVNLCEMDVDFAQEISNVINKVYTDFPAARGLLTNFSLYNADMSSANTVAVFQAMYLFASSNTANEYPYGVKTMIMLNSKYFLNQKKLESSVQSSSTSGHFPKNATAYSPVAHEFGHALSYTAMLKTYDYTQSNKLDSKDESKVIKAIADWNEGKFSKTMAEEAYNNYKKDTGDTIEFDDFRATISQYAVAKDNAGKYIYDETIAEAFHDVYLNGDQAVPASHYVVDVLKEKLK